MNSYTSEKRLKLTKPKCEKYDKTTIITLSDSHLPRKIHFHKNPIYRRIYADSEGDDEIDCSSIGNRTINIHRQNPILNGYHNESELVMF